MPLITANVGVIFHTFIQKEMFLNKTPTLAVISSISRHKWHFLTNDTHISRYKWQFCKITLASNFLFRIH